ncbi:hypothetical protein BJ986_000557 [Phycicoccus badiiscoriae]|uniref:Uncharacterized protein n=1 Tax=Pedococcus badiiscoriae TaxID=642776 RepID=A0A852WBP0_9MICO|nr:hypothetical protein [Pedococcus badiiscoriae]NYG06070.1 hypothetical protein [Pedococcus badiiscoriae]
MDTAQARRRDRLNRWLWAVIDSAAWVVAVFLAVWLRYDLALGNVLTAPILWFSVAAVLGQVIFGAFFGPYAVGHDRGSFD